MDDKQQTIHDSEERVPMQLTTYQLNTPCSIALLTDMHNTPWEPIAQRLADIRPDMICIAGDLIYGNRHSNLRSQTNVLPLLQACHDTAPTFFSIGNHDWVLTAEELAVIGDTGVIVLDNIWTEWNGIVIGGLTSGIALKLRLCEDWRNNPAPAIPETDWLEEFELQKGYRILLCHHPEYFPTYFENRSSIDLILSGHAHGGQWRFFDRGIFAPCQGLFPKLTSGVHKSGHSSLVISRGLSNPSWIPRINNPTEIVLIR